MTSDDTTPSSPDTGARTDGSTPSKLRPGTIVRLNRDSSFGYVRDGEGIHTYIFMIGKAISHVHSARLAEGKAVQFRVSGEGRVDELIVP